MPILYVCDECKQPIGEVVNETDPDGYDGFDGEAPPHVRLQITRSELIEIPHPHAGKGFPRTMRQWQPPQNLYSGTLHPECAKIVEGHLKEVMKRGESA